jgi:hypothetical protein
MDEPKNDSTGGRGVDPRTVEELRRLARSNPTSGQGQAAKLGAIRALERLGRPRSGVPEMPEGWHPHPHDGWAALDECDSEAVRRKWWANLWTERHPNVMRAPRGPGPPPT